MLCWLLAGPVDAQPLFQLLPPAQTKVNFTNPIDENEQLNVLSYEYFYNGAGVAVGDVNNDGLLDLFFTANLKTNKLYLNQGGLVFKDITTQAGALGGRTGGWKTGVSMADVNNDGLLDIYVCYSGKGTDDSRRNQLFINQGLAKDGQVRFTEQAHTYGLDDPGYSTQATFFDYDRDGDLDMFLLNHNVKKYDNLELARLHNETDERAGNKLFENQRGHFVDVTKKAGIYQYPLTFGLGMAVADINRDGWPDIYVTNDYNEPDYLYLNQRNGTFLDATERSMRHIAQFSMGIDIADINNDGLPDIMSLDMLPEDNRRQKLLQLQENYESFELMVRQKLNKQYMRNMLQLNLGNWGGIGEEGGEGGKGRKGEKGGPDTQPFSPSSLSSPLPHFSEIAQAAGVSNTDWSWSPLLADFDNDGYKDLFVTNGYLRDYTNKDFLRYWGDYKIQKAVNQEPVQLMDLVRAMPSTKVPNYIFRNNHDLTFANKQQDWGFMQPTISNGAVYADLDNDGDLELVISNINEPAYIYRNMAREQSQHAYVQLNLVPSASKSAVGANATVYAAGLTQYQELNPVRGYLSSQPTRLHFGLGTATVVDSVVVVWPDQTRQVVRQVSVNQQLTIQQAGSVVPVAAPKLTASVFTPVTSPVAISHEGNPENDFKRQPLMLWMYSHTGPVLAQGDVNKDGLPDLFVSGDAQKPGGVWLQRKPANGAPVFEKLDSLNIGDESTSTVSAAAFFDANGDGYDDLYVARGGYSTYEVSTPTLQDQLYLNDGRGHLKLSLPSLPVVNGSSKSCVRPADFDGDGDIDLFVGGRVLPGRYPDAPVSYLLENKGGGMFSRVTIPFARIGMVTDARWADLNGDKRPDLILTGEFMPIKIYHNAPDGFIDQTRTYFPEPSNGFWQSLAVTDVNGDGQPDIVAGNLGRNSQIRASKQEPADLLYADFDNNGSIDPFFCFYVQGKTYPFVSRDELNDQMYGMRRKFAFYKDYANATATDMFTEDELSQARKLTVTETETMIFVRNGSQFVSQRLPIQAQFAPVTNIQTGDFDHNGTTDLLLFGNRSDNRLKLGSMDANYGCLLSGNGRGGFSYIPQTASGLALSGDVKSVVTLPVGSQIVWLIGAFNQPIQAYTLTRP